MQKNHLKIQGPNTYIIHQNLSIKVIKLIICFVLKRKIWNVFGIDIHIVYMYMLNVYF